MPTGSEDSGQVVGPVPLSGEELDELSRWWVKTLTVYLGTRRMTYGDIALIYLRTGVVLHDLVEQFVLREMR